MLPERFVAADQQDVDLLGSSWCSRASYRGILDTQKAWSREGLDLRQSPLDAEGDEQLLVLVLGVHSPTGGRVGARNGAGSKGAQLDRGVVAALCTAGGSWIIERIVERARNSRRPPL